jgi:hypothetical protein
MIRAVGSVALPAPAQVAPRRGLPVGKAPSSGADAKEDAAADGRAPFRAPPVLSSNSAEWKTISKEVSGELGGGPATLPASPSAASMAAWAVVVAWVVVPIEVGGWPAAAVPGTAPSSRAPSSRARGAYKRCIEWSRANATGLGTSILGTSVAPLGGSHGESSRQDERRDPKMRHGAAAGGVVVGVVMGVVVGAAPAEPTREVLAVRGSDDGAPSAIVLGTALVAAASLDTALADEEDPKKEPRSVMHWTRASCRRVTAHSCSEAERSRGGSMDG